MNHRGLLGVEGRYSGKAAFIYVGEDPVNIYLYSGKGRLIGFGPAYLDASWTELGQEWGQRVTGQFRASGRWSKIPRYQPASWE